MTDLRLKTINESINKLELNNLPMFRNDETLKDLTIADLKRLQRADIYLSARVGRLITQKELEANIKFVEIQITKACIDPEKLMNIHDNLDELTAKTVKELVEEHVAKDQVDSYIKRLNIHEDNLVFISRSKKTTTINSTENLKINYVPKQKVLTK